MNYLSLLTGTWLVVASNFPMWLKPSNSSPQFHYLPMENGNISDRVTYLHKGKEKEIAGVDKAVDDDRHFKWRGNGLLAIASSKWSIVLVDEKQSWMVIHFEKSIFSPKGLDIVARKKLTAEEIDAIKDRVWKETEFGPEIETVVTLAHR